MDWFVLPIKGSDHIAGNCLETAKQEVDKNRDSSNNVNLSKQGKERFSRILVTFPTRGLKMRV